MADLGPYLPIYYGPALPDVRQIVIHSVESGMTPGIGESLMTGWWRNPDNKSSVHGIADPRDYCSSVPESSRAWHCGAGNPTSVGIEHSGRAAFSKDDWLTVAAVKMLNNSARNTARIAKRHDIPLRWLSVAEVKANAKGFCTHNDMRLARGGTTHTDPGPNFPYALYMQLVQQWAGVPVGGTGTNTENTTTPAGSGGAQQEDTNDMADITPAQIDEIAKRVVSLLLSGAPEATFPVGKQNSTVANALQQLMLTRVSVKDIWTAPVGGAGYEAQHLLDAAAGNPKPAEASPGN